MRAHQYLQNILLNTENPRHLILWQLTASDASTLIYSLGIWDDFQHHEKYLNPLRDIDSTMTCLGPMIEAGYTILMLGNFVEMIICRTQDPRAYWAHDAIYRRWESYIWGIWVLAIPPDARVQFERARAQLMLRDTDPEHQDEYERFFEDIITCRVLKQIHVNEDDGPGYRGDDSWEEDGCSTIIHSSDAYSRTETFTTTMRVNAVKKGGIGNISINGLDFEMDWEGVYRESVYPGQSWNGFCYINATRNPFEVLEAEEFSASDEFADLYLGLNCSEKGKAYIPIS